MMRSRSCPRNTIGASLLLLGLISGGAFARELSPPTPASVQGLSATVTPTADATTGPIVGPVILTPVVPQVSPAVDDLLFPTPAAVPSASGPPRLIPPSQADRVGTSLPSRGADPLAAPGAGAAGATPAPLLTFEGLGNADNESKATPPDTNGDVGTKNYVQMVNTMFIVFDKTGKRLTSPRDINQLWTGKGGLCEQRNDGDPIVLYDIKADRWLLTQFATASESGPYALCFAVSKTSDPTGAYYLYEFPTVHFPDYFKIGVWPDATNNGYFVAANESDVGVYALDRVKMLAGTAVTPIFFQQANSNMMLPSHFMGSSAPPAGSPNYFYTFLPKNKWGATNDSIVVYEFKPDFVTPAKSTFSLAATIPVSAFNYTVCGYFNLDCLPQKDTAQKFDAVSEWPMWRLNYRNFTDHESLVGNFTVETTGTSGGQAGIRWFELRKSTGKSWSLYQEGTHAPGTAHRFMGSIAQDSLGNIALGYSVTGSDLFPSIRYATRFAADPPGTLNAEASLTEGKGAQTASDRWGDYSAMGVDPTDDRTFWYTNMYYSATSGSLWQTRVGTFRVPDVYTVTFLGDGHGTVTGVGRQSVVAGGSTSAVTAVPSFGYHFVNWTGTGGFVPTRDNPLTLENVTSDMTVTATFIANPITLGSSEYTSTPKVRATLSYPAAVLMQFSLNSKTWTPWEAYATGKTLTVPAGSGPKTVYCRFRDANDVVSDIYSDTIVLDTKAPSGTVTINDGSPYTNNRTVTLEITPSDRAGVLAAVCISEQSRTCAGEEFEPFAATLEYTLTSPGDGRKTVYTSLRDAAGNTSRPLAASIILDTVPPTGGIVINRGAETTASTVVQLTLTAAKAAEMQISVDGGATWGVWEKFASRRRATLPADPGEQTVKVRFRDLAGNVSVDYEASITLL